MTQLNITENLKKLRKNHNLTQNEVAFFLSIDRTTYTFYETGTTQPSLKTIVLLSKLYNLSTDEILIGKTKH